MGTVHSIMEREQQARPTQSDRCRQFMRVNKRARKVHNVAKLTKAEQEALDRLEAKRDAREEGPPASRSIQAIIDFGNEKSIEAARKYGWLDSVEDETVEESEEDDEEADDTPRRKGYFGKRSRE